MKHIFYCYLLIIYLCFDTSLKAQSPIWNATSFAFNKDTSSFVDMSGSTTVSFNGAYSNTPLFNFPSGFQFRFGVTDYNNLAISSYGYIKIGGNIFTINPTLQDSIISVLYTFPSSFTTCSYKLIGTAPNRKFVIEWSGNYLQVGAVKFQLWLSERTGTIQFVYDAIKNYKGKGSADYKIYCKTKVFNESVIAVVKTGPLNQLPIIKYAPITLQDLNYDSILAKTRFTFQPDTIKPIQPGTNFTNVLPGCLDVVMKDSSNNEYLFRVERNDGDGFKVVSQFLSTSTTTTGNFYTYNNNKLQPDSNYTFRIFASNGFLCSDIIEQTIRTPMPLLSGIRKIPGDYPSINALLQDASCKHLGPELVIELQPSYNFSAEAGTVYFYPFLQTKVLRHVTIRPEAGANLSLSASVASPLILVDSVRNIEIDGRAGGVGVNSSLTLRQLNNSWPVVSYIRYADSGIIRYCTIEGNSTNGDFGLVYLGAYSPSYYNYKIAGVDGNVVANCKIGPQSGFTYKGIVVESYERGKGITIRDNEIYRFYNEAIDYRYGGKDSRITNNRLYQPAPVNFLRNTPQAVAAMLFTDVENNLRIDSNKIGGSSPAWGIGNWYQNISTSNYAIILLTSDISGATGYISNNQIANISAGGSTFRGISVPHGAVVIDGNRLGSADSVNSISSAGSHYGIVVGNKGVKIIKNNFFSGLQTNYPTYSGNSSLGLILADNMAGKPEDSLVISNNDIGGSDNYNANRSGGTATGIGLTAVKKAIVKGNTIRGISSKSNGVWGMSQEWNFTTPTIKNVIIDSNIVHHLEGKMTVYGIYTRIYATMSSSISNNHIYALRGIGPSVSPGATQPAIMLPISVEEFLYSGALDTNVVRIANNKIHSMDYVTPSGGYSYQMTGIGASGRRLRIYNNMIALGIGKNGLSTDSTELEITGINLYSAAVKAEAEHNSVYIGGTGNFATGILLPANSNVKNIFVSNNIIQLDRAKNISFGAYTYMDGSGPAPHNNIISNNNLWYSKIDTSINTKLKNWRAACHCDSATIVADPLFVNPGGDSATQDLHLKPGSPADSAGTLPFGNVTSDIDNNLRSAFSPVDIGADAVGPCAGGNISLQLSPSQDSVSICGDNGFNLNATVLGGTFNSVQWQWNMQDIPAATTLTYSATKSGWYRLVGKTSCGKIASKSIYLSGSIAGSQVNITQNDTTICLGSYINLSATGANSYVWSGPDLNATTSSISVQPSASGDFIYTVTGTANNCSSTDQIKLTVVNLPVVTISPADTSICNGTSVSLTAFGANTYSWSPTNGLDSTTGSHVDAQPNSTTTYTVTGKNSIGCTAQKAITIVVMPVVIPLVNINVTSCSTNSVSLKANAINGGALPQYQWYLGNTLLPATDSSITINNVTNGSQVYATLTSSETCANPKTVNSNVDTITCLTTSTPTIDGVESLIISPNPASGNIAVKIKLNVSKKISLVLYDMLGKPLYRSESTIVYSNYLKNIDVSGLPLGTYYVLLRINSSQVVQKIVVAR